MAAPHWIDLAFEEWSKCSQYTDLGIHRLEAMRLSSLEEQVRSAISAVNSLGALSPAEWRAYCRGVAQGSRQWPEPIIGLSPDPTTQPRIWLRREPPGLSELTRARLQILVFEALTNENCGSLEIGYWGLQD